MNEQLTKSGLKLHIFLDDELRLIGFKMESTDNTLKVL